MGRNNSKASPSGRSPVLKSACLRPGIGHLIVSFQQTADAGQVVEDDLVIGKTLGCFDQDLVRLWIPPQLMQSACLVNPAIRLAGGLHGDGSSEFQSVRPFAQ